MHPDGLATAAIGATRATIAIGISFAFLMRHTFNRAPLGGFRHAQRRETRRDRARSPARGARHTNCIEEAPKLMTEAKDAAAIRDHLPGRLFGLLS